MLPYHQLQESLIEHHAAKSADSPAKEKKIRKARVSKKKIQKPAAKKAPAAKKKTAPKQRQMPLRLPAASLSPSE